jgi:outer membrane protein assembly factor BamB
MAQDTLEHLLRRATRNFHSGLPEAQTLDLGRQLCRELERAHAEVPPRHPSLDPAGIATENGTVRLEGGSTQGDVTFDLFQVGCLLTGLAQGREPDVSWRLDGPPQLEASTAAGSSAIRGLATFQTESRFLSAAAAAEAFEAALAPSVDPPVIWPAFRGGRERSGARPAAEAPLRLEPVWDLRIGAIVASAVVGGSTCWTVTHDGRVLFVDRPSGRLQLCLPGRGVLVESSPAVIGRLLVYGTDAGDFVVVDLVAGKEVNRIGLAEMIRSSPLPYGEIAILGTIDAKGTGGVCAVDPADGKTRWRRRLAPVFSSPAVVEHTLLVGTDEGTLVALDADSGELRFSVSLGGKVRSTPAVSGELAFVGDFSGRVVAVKIADGELAWTAELGHQLYSSPCVAGGLCVVGCNEGHLHGLDALTGEARFAIETRGPVIGSALALGDRFVAGSTDGTLYLFDSAGQVLERRDVAPVGIASSPATGDGYLVVGSAIGLHALRAVA